MFKRIVKIVVRDQKTNKKVKTKKYFNKIRRKSKRKIKGDHYKHRFIMIRKY